MYILDVVVSWLYSKTMSHGVGDDPAVIICSRSVTDSIFWVKYEETESGYQSSSYKDKYKARTNIKVTRLDD